LPREAVAACSLAVFKARLGGFEQLGLVEGVPAYGRGGGTKRSSEVPSNPNPSVICDLLALSTLLHAEGPR